MLLFWSLRELALWRSPVHRHLGLDGLAVPNCDYGRDPGPTTIVEDFYWLLKSKKSLEEQEQRVEALRLRDLEALHVSTRALQEGDRHRASIQ